MDSPRLHILLTNLDRIIVNDIKGEVVEFGCYVGTTSLFIRRLLIKHSSSKEFHVYDSFSGLPDKTIEDASVAGIGFKAGELKATKRDLVRNFKKAGLKPPVIHKGWFNELKPKDLPQNISFAFIDGDFYNSTTDSLELIWPLLSNGGVIIVDDYMRSNLPGVYRAISNYFANKDARITHQKNLAIIQKNTPNNLNTAAGKALRPDQLWHP